MIEQLIRYYLNYKILAEDEDLRFSIVINRLTDDVLKRWKFYEIDHEQKTIYLELNQNRNNILIVTNDELELPLAVVKNLNEAADIMNVNATHVYRAYRRAGRPDRLHYNNYILIKNII